MKRYLSVNFGNGKKLTKLFVSAPILVFSVANDLLLDNSIDEKR